MANKRQNQTQRQRQCRFKYATITESQMLFIEHSLGQELLLGKKTPLFFQSEQDLGWCKIRMAAHDPLSPINTFTLNLEPIFENSNYFYQ